MNPLQGVHPLAQLPYHLKVHHVPFLNGSIVTMQQETCLVEDMIQFTVTSCSCVHGSFDCYKYCSSGTEGGGAKSEDLIHPLGEKSLTEAPTPNKVVGEASPSDAPRESPTTVSDAQQDDNDHGHHGKRGKMMDKSNKKNSLKTTKKSKKKQIRKHGERLNRGAGGGD